jgi:Dolichyl-phosphate-mannose-protein mannosyltransferase
VPANSRKRKSLSADRAPVPTAPEPSIFGLPRLAFLPLALMCAIILLMVAARIRLLGVPLERDEGEYAYMGRLMLQGFAPYGVAANMKLPGTAAAYALAMAVFGQSVSGIHLGFLLVNLGSVVLVFFLGKRLFGPLAGVAAAASYAVLSVDANMLGMWAHATHFVVLPALGATLLMLRWGEKPKLTTLAASGLLYGVAFLMKQPGILFALFGGLYLIYHQRKLRNVLLFGAAVALPFGITCLLLWWAGVFGRFWFWVFTYAREYVSMLSVSAGAGVFSRTAAPIVKTNAGICLLAAAGLIVGYRARKNRSSTILVAGFLVCSFLAVCPGLYFRKHYFILMLPAVALLAGIVATTAKNTVMGTLPLWAIVAALAFTIWQQGDYLFRLTPVEVSRSVYGSNPFPEAIPLAAYIRDHTEPGDRIAVVGSEPEIYFYADRRSVTSYVYVYSMVEPQPYAPRMQADFIHDVEAGSPKYIVLVNVSASWLLQPNSPNGVLRWIARYTQEHYETVAIADISRDRTVYRWNSDAVNYRPQSPNAVIILKRKADRS